MKRMFIYALLFLGTAILCLLAVYGITRYQLRQEEPIPNTILESETVPDMEGFKPGRGASGSPDRGQSAGGRVFSGVRGGIFAGILQ